MTHNELRLPPISRMALVDLYVKAQAAKRDYDVALNSTVAALGLDPALPHSVNLDTGAITPAPQLEGE